MDDIFYKLIHEKYFAPGTQSGVILRVCFAPNPAGSLAGGEAFQQAVTLQYPTSLNG